MSSDSDWAMRSMAYVGLIPKTKIFAEFRAQIEASARADERAKVLAELNICEVCEDYLEPQPVRCERHVHTERNDEGEWDDF